MRAREREEKKQKHELIAIYGSDPCLSIRLALTHSPKCLRFVLVHMHKYVPPLQYEQNIFNIKLSINRLLHIIRNHYGYLCVGNLSKY